MNFIMFLVTCIISYNNQYLIIIHVTKNIIKFRFNCILPWCPSQSQLVSQANEKFLGHFSLSLLVALISVGVLLENKNIIRKPNPKPSLTLNPKPKPSFAWLRLLQVLTPVMPSSSGFIHFMFGTPLHIIRTPR